MTQAPRAILTAYSKTGRLVETWEFSLDQHWIEDIVTDVQYYVRPNNKNATLFLKIMPEVGITSYYIWNDAAKLFNPL